MLTVLAAMAEMKRDLLIERTQAGLARAKAQGKILGRLISTTDEQRKAMVTRHLAGAKISALAKDYEISRASVMPIVKPLSSCESQLSLQLNNCQRKSAQEPSRANSNPAHVPGAGFA